jgi:hypothetical protein
MLDYKLVKKDILRASYICQNMPIYKRILKKKIPIFLAYEKSHRSFLRKLAKIGYYFTILYNSQFFLSRKKSGKSCFVRFRGFKRRTA